MFCGIVEQLLWMGDARNASVEKSRCSLAIGQGLCCASLGLCCAREFCRQAERPGAEATGAVAELDEAVDEEAVEELAVDEEPSDEPPELFAELEPEAAIFEVDFESLW